MTDTSRDAAATDQIVAGFLHSAIQNAQRRTDAYIYRGLDTKTVAYMRAMVDKNPNLRQVLSRAADLRESDRRAPRRKIPQFVYFIQNATTGAIKIGTAADPIGRLSTLQTLSRAAGSDAELLLIGITTGGMETERALHQRFAATRIRGEWFAPSLELLSVIEEASA